MNNRIEIRLTEINDQPVGLGAMNADALQSFIVVISSLKSIAEKVVNKEDLSYSIQEGSALCCVEAPNDSLSSIYQEMDAAIKGESSNKEVTDGLRRIQEQIKRDDLGYEFNYRHSSTVVNIHGRLLSANRIGLKRRRKTFKYQLSIIPGLLNQIGGVSPNYHIDHGAGEKTTIDCSVEDAKYVREYLYEKVYALVLCKIYDMPEKKDEFFHLTMIEVELLNIFRDFVSAYNGEEELIERLGNMHDFIDETFASTGIGHRILKKLLLGFNNKRFHLSEIKTLLVISKPFKEHELIRQPRHSLLETYNAKRS